MKRRRISKATDSDAKRGRKKSGKVSRIHSQYSVPSFADLPKDILVNIVLRLPIKGILVCKFVCKTWYDLISDPEFAKLHLDQAQVYPLIRVSDSRFLSGMLYLLQPDKNNFELKLGMCDHSYFKFGCVCNVKVNLDTGFELPKRKDCIIYRIVNSCNGFLCLSDPSDHCALLVCNPITGEFINLPKAKKLAVSCWEILSYGLGFSPTTDQYKVIRLSRRRTKTDTTSIKVEVHIIGSESWIDTGFFTLLIRYLSPTYLNGFLYWSSNVESLSIISFNIEKECFGSVSAPAVDHPDLYENVSMGVLGEELCICGFLKSGFFHVWAMKDHGAEKSWHQVFSMDMHFYPMWLEGPLKPMKYLNDGSLLMFHSYTNALIYMDSRKGGVRYLRVHGKESLVEAIAHIPSFVSLKHALCGHNLKLLNVGGSRSLELKPPRRAEDIYIVEENV